MAELFTQKWAIVSLFDSVDEGTVFHYTDFPLHLTLAGVFAINKTGQELVQELTQLLHQQGSFPIKATRNDLFGPDKNIAVTRIEENPNIIALHRLIHSWLTDSGAAYNSPQYQGEGFLPHSTFQKSGRLAKDQEKLITSVSLIDLYPNKDGYQRKIAKTIPLQ